MSHPRFRALVAQLQLLGRPGTSDDYVGWCGQASDWWSRQRLGSSYHALSAGRAFKGWWDRFGAEHPEWFVLQRNGSRTPGRLPAEREKMCFSNPQLVQQVVGEKIAELKRDPSQDSVSVSPNDGGGNNSVCLCEACRRLDPANGNPMPLDTYLDGKKLTVPYVSLSDRTFTFYNRVAEGLAKVYPDKLLGTYAYATYRDLPLGVRPHPNLLVGFVGMGYWDDEQLEADRHRWEQWAGAAKNLFLRPNAFHQGHGMPGVFVTKLDRDIKRCYQTGMIAADFDSVLHHWATQGLKYYVLAKLLWDPSQDTEAIIEDYCQKGFGPAGRVIRRYFRQLEEVTDRCAAGSVNEAEGKTSAGEIREEELDETAVKRGETYLRLARAYTPAVIARLRETLAEARSAAGNDERLKQRIAFLETGLRYGELQAEVHREFFANRADKAPLLRLLDERHEAFREIVRRQPFAVNVAYIAWREGSMWRRTGWKPPVAADDDYFPPPESGGGWRAIVAPNATPTKAEKRAILDKTGLNWDKLKSAWDYDMRTVGTGDQWPRDPKKCLLIIRRGWIAFEQYHSDNGSFNKDTRVPFASGTKTLVGVSFAKMFSEGLCKDTDYLYQYLPKSWAEAEPARKKIHIRHVLFMSSGLEPFDGPYEPATYPRIIKNLAVIAEPGTQWFYNTGALDLMNYVIADRTGQTLEKYLNDKILRPIGGGGAYVDSRHKFEGHGFCSFCRLTPRDYARIGYLFLKQGRWGKKQLIDRGVVSLVTSPPPWLQKASMGDSAGNPEEPNKNYAYTFWLNRTGRIPGIPADAFMASGGNHKMIVIPSLDMVIARYGNYVHDYDEVNRVYEIIRQAVTDSPGEMPRPSVIAPSIPKATRDEFERII